MQNRSLTTISALLLGVVLCTAPALASGTTAGNKGSTDAATTNRDAPLTLPGKGEATAPGKIDSSHLNRAFGDDPAAAVESMGTATLNSDGTITEQPASASMRAIVEAASKGSEVAAPARAIVGTDDRVQITDASGYPSRVIGWLWSQDQKDGWGTCTATLIGPYTLLTAAHCVYDHATGGWVKQSIFMPGVTDAENAPYGTFEYDTVNILKGYIDNYDGTNYGSVLTWDLAVITLTEEAGNQLGWMGFRADDASEFKAQAIGYPGDKPDGTMWDTKCAVPAANFGDQAFWHECDMFSGNSGGSMFEDAGGGDLYIRGINVAEDEKVNYGLRLTDSYYQFIVDNYK